ncbi:MAG: TonB-dependent receptor, partial [Rhizorhabdus sp.]
VTRRSHAPGHGDLDLNGLIPETVDHLAYRKGPYRAADGDFSFVGAASLATRDRFDQSFATLAAGSYGYRRAAVGTSAALGDGTMLLATEITANDGPWALAERLRHVSAFGKYSRETPLGTLRASLSVYDARWRPTEQIPVRAIGTVLPDRFGTLDPFLRGATDREVLNIGVTGSAWTITGYAQHYRFNLLSNFTFFLDDPVRGDELEQAEDRWTFGGRIARRVALAHRLDLTVGADTQTDAIGGLGLFHTERGRRIGTRSLVDARETSISGYAEANWTPVERVRLLAGGRVDHYAFRTVARGGKVAGGTAQDTIVTPKLGATVTVNPNIALYANYGQGFHSNAIRGVIAAQEATPAFARATGYEVGGRFERSPFDLSLTHWWSRSSSELIYSGDDGTVAPTGPSHRRGFELVGNIRAARWLTLDGVYATNHARFVDAQGADRIPNALESAGEFGLTGTFRAFDAALRVRYLGTHALTEDDKVRSPATTVVNLRAGRHFGAVAVDLELLNLFDTARADADYYYTSRLPGEPLDGVEGVHSRTVEPRMIRIGATIRV